MTFEDFMTMKIQMSMFWVYTLCNIGGINQYFRETCWLHLQGRSVETGKSEVI